MPGPAFIGLHQSLRELNRRARISQSAGFDFKLANVEAELFRLRTTNEFAHLVAVRSPTL